MGSGLTKTNGGGGNKINNEHKRDENEVIQRNKNNESAPADVLSSIAMFDNSFANNNAKESAIDSPHPLPSVDRNCDRDSPVGSDIDHEDQVEDERVESAAEMFAVTAMSLGMDNDDLLFNLMYFEEGAVGTTFGSMMNNVQQETLALYSENNTPYKLKPASANAIAELSVKKFDPKLDSIDGDCECAVCKDDIEQDVSIIRLPLCKHYFHEECLLKWIKLQGWCPVCRSDINPTANENEDALVNENQNAKNRIDLISEDNQEEYELAMYHSMREYQLAHPDSYDDGNEDYGEDDNSENGMNYMNYHNNLSELSKSRDESEYDYTIHNNNRINDERKDCEKDNNNRKEKNDDIEISSQSDSKTSSMKKGSGNSNKYISSHNNYSDMNNHIMTGAMEK
eukprot:gene4276-6056_t